MPAYPFLFENRRVSASASPNALRLTGNDLPLPGFEVVPKPEAVALVNYLLSLRADTPLFEAPPLK